MGGFDKIELGKKEESRKDTLSSGGQDFARMQSGTSFMSRRSGKKKFKFSRKKTSIIAGVLAAILVLVGIPAYLTYDSGLKTYRQAKLVAAAMDTQNVEQASKEIEITRKHLKNTQRSFKFLIPFKFVPVIGWYYSDLGHMLNAGSHGLEAATVATDAIKPYADVLGLKGEGSFSEGSAEDRIKTAVLTIGKITPEVDRIAVSLEKVQVEIDEVNPDHYPAFLFGPSFKSRLENLKKITDQGVSFVTDAKPLVKVLPSLLGEEEPKKYLILFQNDKELRPTGGFITAFAIFNVDKGVIKIERSDDIYDLDNSISGKPPAPDAIQRYLANVSVLNLRDSNVSPDFIESMETFNSLYEKSGQSVDVDGIIALDTSVLVSTIKVLDDQVQAGGMTFNTQIDERCDCPQVIYELENTISRPVNYVKTDRKSLIGELLQAIMTKAFSSSPKIYWGPLFQTILTEADQKHVLVYLYNKEAQQGIEALNYAGRIRDFEGDYLHINESSFSGAKVNIFLEEEVENKYEVDKEGIVTKTVTITYKNPYPPSDCNLESGGLCLNAEYRDWLRIYVPQGSELVDSEGSQVKIETSEEFGKTLFEGFITVRPQGSKKFSITYKLPFKLEKGSPLPLMIQKQPGTHGNVYTNVVNGKTIETFPLLTDKEALLKI